MKTCSAGGRSRSPAILGRSAPACCGVVECDAPAPAWLPYVAVRDVAVTTQRAEALGARVLVDPREGPHGWRSVVSTPQTGELALWQPKR